MWIGYVSMLGLACVVKREDQRAGLLIVCVYIYVMCVYLSYVCVFIRP